MQVVIEINDELYDVLGKAPYIRSGDKGWDIVLTAIKNGIPLGQYCEQCCPYYLSESEDD